MESDEGGVAWQVWLEGIVSLCSLCHYPKGKGRPENANITGLTYEYFIQQMMDFRNGARKTSDPKKPIPA